MVENWDGAGLTTPVGVLEALRMYASRTSLSCGRLVLNSRRDWSFGCATLRSVAAGCAKRVADDMANMELARRRTARLEEETECDA